MLSEDDDDYEDDADADADDDVDELDGMIRLFLNFPFFCFLTSLLII